MKELRDNLGQLIFWSIAFGILLGMLSLTGCETQPKKVKQYETVPAPVEIINYEGYSDRICMKGCHNSPPRKVIIVIKE